MSKKKHAGGRPKKKIDYELVLKLSSILATQEEIAEILNISVRTLQRDKEFCHVFKKGIAHGKMSLRRKQFKLAEKNAAMAIFLGKNILKQTDKQEINVSVKEYSIALED